MKAEITMPVKNFPDDLKYLKISIIMMLLIIMKGSIGKRLAGKKPVLRAMQLGIKAIK